MELRIRPRKPLSEVLAKAEGKPPPERTQKKPEPSREKHSDFKLRVDELKRVKGNQARDFMIHIEKEPDLSVTERYKAMGLSAYMGNRIQKELVETGYIIEVRRGKPVYLELTDKGSEAIRSPKRRMAGKGSPEHQMYQRRIKEFYVDLGYSAEIEKDVYGKSIDVLVNKGGRLIAIEIELNVTDHIMENISRDFTVGVDEVVVVTTKDLLGRIREKVEKALGGADIKGLSFDVVDRYM